MTDGNIILIVFLLLGIPAIFLIGHESHVNSKANDNPLTDYQDDYDGGHNNYSSSNSAQPDNRDNSSNDYLGDYDGGHNNYNSSNIA
jgi:hypothetical protein